VDVRRHGVHVGGRHDARHLGHLHPCDGVRAVLAVQELDGHRLRVGLQLLGAGQRFGPAGRERLVRSAERVVAGPRVVRANDPGGFGPVARPGVHHHPVPGRAHERVGAPPLDLVAAQLHVHEAAGAQHAAVGRGRTDEPRKVGASARGRTPAAGRRHADQVDEAARAAEVPVLAGVSACVPVRRRRLDERVLGQEPKVPVVLRHVHVADGELDADGRARIRFERERLTQPRARAPHRKFDVRPRVVRDRHPGLSPVVPGPADAVRARVRAAAAAVHAPRPVRPGVRLRRARRAGRVDPGHGHPDPFFRRPGHEPEHARQVPAAAPPVEEHVLRRPEVPGTGGVRPAARRRAHVTGPLPPLRRLVHELVPQQELEREQNRALLQVDLHRQLVGRRRVRLRRRARPHVPGVVAE